MRKDGEVNPEGRTNYSDYMEWHSFTNAVSSLSKAYQLTKDNKYGIKTKELISTWFLNPETKMNPNLNYAQGVRGESDGRQFGIIEFGGIDNIMDEVEILGKNNIVDKQFTNDFKNWVLEYANWLQNSKLGKLEANATNNHGTTYDLQLSHILIYLNEKEKLVKLLEQVKTKRIAVQVELDGKQPEELTRTKAFSYSLLNLNGLTQLAIIGKKYGVNLWDYENQNGGSIKKAYDFLIPYLDKDWPYKQIETIEFSRKKLVKMLENAAKIFNDNHYLEIAKAHQK